MNHLDPAWLQSFVAIADSGALARAAGRVHRSPSALSLQLKQLESTLGTRLVERTTRQLRLTGEGERFLPYARELLDLQQAALRALQPAADLGVCRIGLSEYFLPSRLKTLLGFLEAQAAGARLEVTWARSSELQRQWAEGALDLAVVTAHTPPADSLLLRREPLAWVAAPGFHASPSQPLPLVLLAEPCPVRELALAALARRGQAHSLRMACSGSQAVVTALRAGWGVGCLNSTAVPADLVVLSEKDPKRWPSPGRLAFYGQARPAAAALLRPLKAWAMH